MNDGMKTARPDRDNARGRRHADFHCGPKSDLGSGSPDTNLVLA